MSAFLADVRFAVRLLARSPVFAVTATLLLAAGIAANTLIFSVVDALLLRPLPVPHPENLVRLVEVHPHDFVTWSLPYNLCDAAAALDRDFSAVVCQGEADVAFRYGPSTERVRVHLVSPNFFSSLGVHACLGRVLTAEDERTRARNAVLGYGFWQRRFGGDPSALGRSIVLGGHPFTVVGVSPEGFNGLAVETSPDIRVPAAVDRALVRPNDEMNPAARPLFAQIFGRLRDELDRIFPPAPGTAPAAGAIHSRLRLESIVNGVSPLRAQFSRGLEVLMAGVALLLLMACANVAGLLLARSAGRAQEIGVRLALGASPGRIVRQFLAEGLPLALAGGIAGVLLAIASLPLLIRGLPPVRDRAAVLQPLAMHLAIDLRVLAFAVGATVLSAVLFALWPALRCARADLLGAVTGRTATRRALAGNLVVTAQVALCTVVLMGAALLAGALERIRSIDPGFDRDRIVTFTIDPGIGGYAAAQSRLLSKTLLSRAGTMPGAAAVSLASRALMRGTGVKATFGAAGAPIDAADFLNSSLNDVTPGYFESMGMHLLAGRDFTWFDHNRGTPRKAIVNLTFAARFFPGRNPVGQRIGFPGAGGIANADDEIVGVVTDAKYRSLREPVPPTVYRPVVDGFDTAFILHVRTGQRPETMVAPVREMLRSLDPELPLIEVRTLRQEVEASLWQGRLLALLSTLFAATAGLLAGIGLYGALDYAVKSRTREVGVRIALGAHPARIVVLYCGAALRLTAAGLALGLCAWAAATVWIRQVLYEVRPWEPAALVSVVLLVALLAAMAAAPATLRAARIDPASALRAE
ncbi:MAG: ABC transporter permease [Acidobacteriia bacterium]|nr:ABC transporter permease [Terriglobia bacterium]